MINKLFSQWFVDQAAADQFHCFGVRQVLVDHHSSFQRIQIIEVESLGKCLIIDGKIQSTEKDEFIYHEALIHPAVLLHPHLEKVLLLGVGEGATIRELLKYENLTIVAVDIDAEMIEFSRTYLREWHDGAFEDPRVKMFLEDGWDFIQKTEEKFDLIVMDLPEPYPDTPAYRLYTPEFYRLAVEKMNPNALLVTQGETTKPGQEEHHYWIKKNLQQVFPSVFTYQTYIPSYDSSWGFLLAGRQSLNPFVTAEEIDRKIKEKVKGSLKFYDGQTHLSMFYLPRHLRNGQPE